MLKYDACPSPPRITTTAGGPGRSVLEPPQGRATSPTPRAPSRCQRSKVIVLLLYPSFVYYIFIIISLSTCPPTTRRIQIPDATATCTCSGPGPGRSETLTRSG